MAPSDKSRVLAAIASAAIEALILLALITGLRDHPERRRSRHLVDIAFTAPAISRQKRPKPRLRVNHSLRHASARAGARAVPALAYVPRIPLAPPSLPAASKPDSGPGSNSGMGGTGDAAGKGTSGESSGDDGGSDAEWIAGRIGNSDYPSRAADRGAHGTVRTEITVAADGRVAGCQVIRSSGDADLDATTCRLVAKRFRFRPATDAAGRAITDTVDYDQEWILSHR
jgi:protein TonB